MLDAAKEMHAALEGSQRMRAPSPSTLAYKRVDWVVALSYRRGNAQPVRLAVEARRGRAIGLF
jgi:hypothetical protein